MNDNQIDEVIELMCQVDPDGTLWGMDTNLGNIVDMRENIKKIIGRD